MHSPFLMAFGNSTGTLGAYWKGKPSIYYLKKVKKGRKIDSLAKCNSRSNEISG